MKGKWNVSNFELTESEIAELNQIARECAVRELKRMYNASNSGLKECPFCGGIAEVRHHYKSDGFVSYKISRVECIECGCMSPSVIIDGFMGADTTEQDAIDAWNRRW